MSFHLGAYQDWANTLTDKDSEQLYLQPLWLQLKNGHTVDEAYALVQALSKLSRKRVLFIDEIEQYLWKEISEKLKDEHEVTLLIYVNAKILGNNIERLSGTHDDRTLGRLFDVFKFLHLGPPVEIPTFVNSLTLESISEGEANTRPIAAIIDDGLGFLNRRFRKADDNHRFSRVWLQNYPQPPEEASFLPPNGVVWPDDHSGDISGLDEAAEYRDIHTDTPHAFEGYSTAQQTSHGSLVADLAFGADPKATDKDSRDLHAVDLLGVQLPRASIKDTTGKHLDSNVLQAMRWLIVEAMNKRIEDGEELRMRPLIVTLSLGPTAGAKDGTDFLSQQLERLLRLYSRLAKPENLENEEFARAYIANGNAGAETLTAIIDCGASDDNMRKTDWHIQTDDRTASYLELQTVARDMPQVLLVDPNGVSHTIPPLCAGQYHNLSIAGALVGRVYAEQLPENSCFKHRWVIALAPSIAEKAGALCTPAGFWGVTFAKCDEDTKVALLVERDDTLEDFRPHGRQSYLQHPFANQYDSRFGDYAGVGLPLLDAGNNNPWPGKANGHLRSVGASLITRGNEDVKAWRYASKASDKAVFGTQEGTLGPDYSAPASRSHVSEGIRTSGTLSGSSTHRAGSSISAPQLARIHLLNLRQSVEIDNVRKLPVPPNAQAQLGTHSYPCDPPLDGFYLN